MGKFFRLLLFLLLPCLVAYVGWTSGRATKPSYPLLAKRILIDTPNDSIINFSQLRESIESYKIENGLTGSIYFEYLPTGTSIRIAGDDELIASTLMTIPVVMDLYKVSEEGKLNLDDSFQIKEEWISNEYGSLYKKGKLASLTYREAAHLALVDSDSTALNAIRSVTGSILQGTERSISVLDIDFSKDDSQEINISARSYTSFMKCLYFSCHLNYGHSQEILSYLSESDTPFRLKAGIPSNIELAHKIGTFSTSIQSDCGIVYVEKRNYALCILLKGSPEQNNQHIAHISKMAYEYVTARREQ